MSNDERHHAASASAHMPARSGDTSDQPVAPLAGVNKGKDDGILESLGKAIAAPVEGAAEPDESANHLRQVDTPRT